MAGKLAQGVVLSMDSIPSGTAVTIGNVTNFSGPSGSPTIIDATDLSSSAKEKMVGLVDEGQFTFSVNYDPNNASHIALATARTAKALKAFELDLNGTDSITFSGYVINFEIEGGVDALLAGSVTIEISGSVTWPTV